MLGEIEVSEAFYAFLVDVFEQVKRTTLPPPREFLISLTSSQERLLSPAVWKRTGQTLRESARLLDCRVAFDAPRFVISPFAFCPLPTRGRGPIPPSPLTKGSRVRSE
jgi:hypothetical protein